MFRGRGRRAWIGLATAGVMAVGLVTGLPGVPAAQASARAGYTSVVPTRIADTRSGLGGHAGALGPGAVMTLQVAGQAGVPTSGVAAVALNLTAVTPTTATFLTLYPAGSTRPTASTLNVAAGETRANLVFATLGSNGQVSIANSGGSVQVLVDVSGWYATGSAYTGVAPTRILDTRIGLGAAKAAVAANTSITVQVTGVAGVPTSGVAAVAVNLTGTAPTTATFLTAYPAGSSRPNTSNLNLVAGQTAAVLSVTAVGTGGAVSIYNSGGSVQVVGDVVGWFRTGGEFTPITPTRILDTRTSAAGPLAAGESRAVPLVTTTALPAPGTGTAILSVTAVAPTASTFLTVYPEGAARPTASTLNAPQGAVVPNLVVADAHSANVMIYNLAGRTNIVVDLVGWIASAPHLSAGTTFTGTVGARVSWPLPYADLVIPDAWSVVSGALPAGLTLDPTSSLGLNAGLIEGTPTTAGTSTFTVEVTDPYGQSADETVTATIAVGVVPSVPATGEVGVSYALTPVPSGGTPPYTWSLTSGTLPAGLSFDPATGALSGTPTAVSTGNVTVTVTDAAGRHGVMTGPLQVYAHVPHGVWAWGSNSEGALGNGGSIALQALSPVQVTGLTGVTALASGFADGYALTSDGSVWAWGYGSNGELGNGTLTAAQTTPVRVSGLTGVQAIAAGSDTAYAVKSDGTVWAWGYGASGALGTGTAAANASTPVQIPGLSKVISVSAAGNGANAYAVTSDGTVWAWGIGADGALGNGTAGSTISGPVQVSGLTGVTGVAAGTWGAVAVKSDGTVWAWGLGSQGEIGNGTTTISNPLPVRVNGLSGVTAVAASPLNRFALTSTGRVWSWGIGGQQLLGTGSTANSLVPAVISGLPTVRAISASGRNGFAITPDGSVWSWGLAASMLGSGQPQAAMTPVRATLLPPVTAIATGGGWPTVYAIGVP